jgi:hypothetical protein
MNSQFLLIYWNENGEAIGYIYVTQNGSAFVHKVLYVLKMKH